MAEAAVHVPPAVLAEQGLVALRGGGGDGICAEPGLDDDILFEGQVPVQQHLFPDDWFHAVFADVLVHVSDEVLECGFYFGGAVGSDARAGEAVDVGVELVAAGVEAFGPFGGSGVEIGGEVVEEFVGCFGVEFDLAAGWFVAEGWPGLLVVAND